MFKAIFLFELKYWFRNWAFYIYAFVFFLVALITMLSAVGSFDSVKATTTSMTYVNSPIVISQFIEGMNQLLYFIFPTIIGTGIYRDYKHNAHSILYSYSFSKPSYLLGKFLSAFVVVLAISVLIGIGLYLGTLNPFANQDLIGPNKFWNYAQGYFINIIPNMLLIGTIVFVITTLSRSVFVSFTSVLIIIVLQGVVGGLASNPDRAILATLLDPSGLQAIEYYTKYWTINEYNNNNLPLEKWYLINRAIWFGVTVLFLLILGKLFTFSQAPFSFRRKKKSERVTKKNFVGLVEVSLPKVNYIFNLKTHLNNVFGLMKMDYKFLAKNVTFMILMGVGLLLMILLFFIQGSMYGTNVLPVTRVVLAMPSSMVELFIIIITFLGAGQLVHRGSISKMSGLIDSSAVPNWVLFASKYIALILIQATLLMVIMIAGILIQSFKGFYHFEIGLYLKQLLGINWISYIIWGGFSLAIQTLFKNHILGFFVLFAFFLFGDLISNLGIEQPVFYFNRLPRPSYSDMNGFGGGLGKYYIFSLYWGLFIAFLGGLTVLFWRRGAITGPKERFSVAKQRASYKVVLPTVLSFAGFIALGSYLYYENKILNEYYSPKDMELIQVEYEKTYKQYEDLLLPRITDVSIHLDLFPETRDFEAKGTFTLKNKHAESIDSILVQFDTDYIHEIEIKGAELVATDDKFGISFFLLKQPLDSGATTELSFITKNKPNTFIRSNSPVKYNGTFMNNSIFPSLGYYDGMEISNNKVREKYDLPPKERMGNQNDMKARQNTYISSDADWVTFEATVSTSKDQIAIAPGYLQKEWEENNRKYYHYKMDREMLNFYAFNSARYEVARDKWNDINIEIYYHKGHDFNVERMIKGVKEGLAYCSTNFSPYQHKQVRILEFPSTMGTFAQSFANTIPFSEGIGFIADVDDDDQDGVDYPFSVTVHEVAHQWWAHQVIGANVQGATMLSESLAEYSSLKVLEHEYGKNQMRRFLQDALDSYLMTRSFESIKELPLMYNENQSYIHYNKGSLVFYAMSEYLGETEFNKILSGYVDKVAFQEPPYTIAGELVQEIKDNTPDSLQYLIKDMFETITLYDNYVTSTYYEKMEDGRYQVTLNVVVSKHRADEEGKKIYEEGGKTLTAEGRGGSEIQSLPLNDYIEIGVFAKSDNPEGKEKILYLKKLKVTDIKSEFTIIVNEEPSEVGVDPYNMLIDTRTFDNRMIVRERE